MPSRRPVLRSTLLVAAAGSAAASIALLSAPTASATDAPTFTFPQLGTVVVDGTVDDAVNYTVYRILDPTCTGTAFPGPNDSCVPQEATDTLVIPAGTYHDEQFVLTHVPTCGATQQDVYNGAYQPTVTASGNHQYLAGGILQLASCSGTSPSSPAPAPSSSSPAPSSSSPAPSSSSPAPSSSPPPSSSSPSPGRVTTTTTPPTVTVTTTPPAVTTTTTAPVTVVPTTSTVTAPFSGGFDAGSGSYTPNTSSSGFLASTGTPHTVAFAGTGLAAVTLGGLALLVGRRRSVRGH